MPQPQLGYGWPDPFGPSWAVGFLGLGPSAQIGPVLELNFLGQTPIPSSLVTVNGNGTYFDSTGTLQQSPANTPRIDWGSNPGSTPRGLLIEEARTNGIRNPRCEGATPGIPGTVPTNWQVNPGPTGISSQIVGTITENGISCVDIRLFGTAGATGFPTIFFETNTGIAATSGQVWAGSVYCRLAAGASIGTWTFKFAEYDSSHTQLIQDTGSTFTPTAAALASQRSTSTATMSQATCANVLSLITATITSGAVVDITLRIGAPQLELGSFATSPILPAIGTPAATTRAGDTVTTPLAGGTATIAIESMYPVAETADAIQFQADNGTNANRIAVFQNAGATPTAVLSQVGGGVNWNQNIGLGAPPGVVNKIAYAFTPSSSAACINSSAAAADTHATAANVFTTLRLGSGAASNAFFNGYVRRVRYWPRALANWELQQVTM